MPDLPDHALADRVAKSPSRRLSVVLPYWFDRPDDEAIAIALHAERAGFERLWIGEMATFDAFALAGAVARETKRIEIIVGPLAAGVRSPAALALGISSVERLGGRPAHLALGASSPEIVSGWHGVPFASPLDRLRETFEATAPILRGERSGDRGDAVRSRGFQLRAPLQSRHITVAVFGPGTLRWGARCADRLVLNLLTESATERLCRRIEAEAADGARPKPHICLWQPVAMGSDQELDESCRRQIANQLSAYLSAPGYRDLFIEAGAGDLVRRALSGESRTALAQELTTDVLHQFVVSASWTDADPLAAALERRFAAGIDEIAIVPSTASDPGAERTLSRLAEIFRPASR